MGFDLLPAKFFKNRKNCAKIFIAAATHVQNDNVISIHFANYGAEIGQRMRWFERWNNTLETGTKLKGGKRLFIGGTNIIDATNIMKP